MIANEAHKQEKEKHDVEEEGMWRSVFRGDGLFTDWQADWLIDDPVAILTD